MAAKTEAEDFKAALMAVIEGNPQRQVRDMEEKYAGMDVLQRLNFLLDEKFDNMSKNLFQAF